MKLWQLTVHHPGENIIYNYIYFSIYYCQNITHIGLITHKVPGKTGADIYLLSFVKKKDLAIYVNRLLVRRFT